jgi:hypothetical protein
MRFGALVWSNTCELQPVHIERVAQTLCMQQYSGQPANSCNCTTELKTRQSTSA